MPKSRPRKGRKPRTLGPRPQSAVGAPRRHDFYEQPCPDSLLIEEFGEEGADWLVEEYDRPLNMADLELERALRAGSFTLDDPDHGPTEYTMAELSATCWMLTQLTLLMAREQGILPDDETGGGEVNHEDIGPVIIRACHSSGDVLFLNHRKRWDFAP